MRTRLPLCQRIIVFLLWPMIAPIMLVLLAGLLIAAWPWILFHGSTVTNDSNET